MASGSRSRVHSAYSGPRNCPVPFANPTDFDDTLITTLVGYFSSIDSFEVEFSALAWFEKRVVYLEPSPDTEFRNMTRALGMLFPQYLPYGENLTNPPRVSPSVTVRHLIAFKRRRRISISTCQLRSKSNVRG